MGVTMLYRRQGIHELRHVCVRSAVVEVGVDIKCEFTPLPLSSDL